MESIPYLVEIPFIFTPTIQFANNIVIYLYVYFITLKAQGHMNSQPMVQKYHATSHVLYSDYF